MVAQLAPYPLIRPGFKGLNKSKAADTTLGGAWALELQNAVFDDAGRVAARRGWMNQTPNGMPVIGYTDSYTKLLLHFNGADGGVVFPDSSSYARTMERLGNSQIKTGAAKFGTAGADCATLGAPAYSFAAATPAAPELQLSTGGDFTVEAWVWINPAMAGTSGTILFLPNPTSATPLSLLVDGTGRLSAAGTDAAGATVYSLVSSVLTYSAYHHVAIARFGSVYSLYVDGARAATTTNATALSAFTVDGSIGRGLIIGTRWGSNSFLGYIDELRYSVGIARYVGATYTVPTTAFGDPQPISATANVLHEFLSTNGGSDPISAGNNQIWHSVTAPINITGSLTPTNNNWQFINFRGYVLGFQEAHAPIFYSGAGNFVPLTATSGAVPSGNCGLAAFGRVWAVDADKQTIKYSGLLDPHDWGSDDSGSIDMRTVWTKGLDTVQGLAAFGAAFVVFGKKHIIIWTDGQGSSIGLDPLNMYVVDTIEGTGLQARDTIQNVGTGDILYLSPTGLQSLARVIQTKNNPLASVDVAVNQYLRGLWISEDPRTIRSTYNATEQFYLLIMPKSGTTFCFDTRQPLEDGTLRCAEWPGYGAYSAVTLVNGNMLIGFAGNIGKYSTYLDKSATYNFVYKSPWMTLADIDPSGRAEFREKIPKRVAGIIYSGSIQTFTYTLSYDFSTTVYSAVSVTTAAGRVSEYGTAEYGTNGVYNTSDVAAVAGTDYAEYGSAYNILVSAEELSGAGRWIQMGVTAPISDSFLAIQQLDLYTKIGANVT